MQRIYATYAGALFLLLGVTALIVNLFVPRLRARRRVAGIFSRLYLRCIGIELTVEGIDQMPLEPCVVVANHSSYIDSIVAVAALPPDFAFVIKREMVGVPLVSLLLRRLGSEFVERFDRHKGASDARRVLRLAATGQSLVFFPEGTFDERRHIGRFMAGAFAVAERARMPVVAVAFHGPRDVMPPSGMMVYRRPIRVEVLNVLPPVGARQASRLLIAQATGLPLAPDPVRPTARHPVAL